MKHSIKLRHLVIVDTLEHYQNAIKRAASPHLKDGYIKLSNLQAMLDAVDWYGPYIAIQDEFTMPHALLKHRVLKTR